MEPSFGALSASLLFGYTQALQNELLLAGINQIALPVIGSINIPRQFISMIPYVVTIIAVSGLVRRAATGGGGQSVRDGGPLMTQIPVLEIRNISKHFPGVIANDNVNLTLHHGEILALLGENGAGKSTLMNIIYGLYQPTSGEILVEGKPVVMHNPNDAIALGIGMVHQHFQLVPVMTVAENIMLGSESVKNGFLDTRRVAARISELSQRYNLDVDPYAMIEDLPVGMRQRVEIVKTLYRNANILILDEPTAVLTPQEIEGLFEVMTLLKEQGRSIIFITHKLKEVLQIADRIAVLRNGQVVGEADPQSATQGTLASLMVGREVILTVEKDQRHPQVSCLICNDLRPR
ncbi:MAG: ATP-binding cassette domain-containing protein [Caldilineaceae bacterium]